MKLLLWVIVVVLIIGTLGYNVRAQQDADELMQQLALQSQSLDKLGRERLRIQSLYSAALEQDRVAVERLLNNSLTAAYIDLEKRRHENSRDPVADKYKQLNQLESTILNAMQSEPSSSIAAAELKPLVQTAIALIDDLQVFNLRINEQTMSQINRERSRSLLVSSLLIATIFFLLLSIAYQKSRRSLGASKNLNQQLESQKSELLNSQRVMNSILEDTQNEKKNALRLADKVEIQLKELTIINTELDNFVYVASHDLKSPLRGLEQLASWIEEDLSDSLDPETQENLRDMHKRINRMEQLLDDLLDYSLIGRSQGQVTQVNTKALVKDVFDRTAHHKNIRLQVSENLPTLKAHRTPLEIIFRNLISNALKHHDKQNGLISISASSTAEGVEFSITDDGPGISLEHQQRVFTMFQTLKPRDEVEGSGMGLALVKKSIESVGGWVKLESDGEHGCTFRFMWPTTMKVTGIDDDK